MAPDHLNFFQPYRSLPAGHENQLTRALLVVLRMSPMAHAAWLRLVNVELQLQRQAAPVRFDTQTRAVRRAVDSDAPADLISVYLTPERRLDQADGVITESDRGQVLDAVIDYGGELLVVIESKLTDADDWQARAVNTSGARVQLADGQQRVVVLWRELLEAFGALRERDLVTGAEAAVLDDFLTYVEEHFSDLGPFRTLGLCRGQLFRANRRLRQVLADAASDEALPDVYGPRIDLPGEMASFAYLRADTENVELAVYPADTLTQAKAFYRSAVTLAAVAALAGDDWEVVPNFHFGHMRRGFVWTSSELDVDAYLKLWQSEIADASAVTRADWPDYWAWLEEQRIAAPNDYPQFQSDFVDTGRSTATPRPGVRLSRWWTLADAERLDGGTDFTKEVRSALSQVNHALAAR